MEPINLLIDICKKLYDRKYVVGSGGNVSIKDDDYIYITPTGSILGFLNREDISIIDINGNILSGKPTSEYRMHLNIYKNKPYINGIIHTHSIYTTGLSIVDKKIDLLTPEGKMVVKKIGYVPYLPSGSKELSEYVGNIKEDVIVLKNHGLVCCGKNLLDAYIKTEVMEEISKLNVITHYLQFPTH